MPARVNAKKPASKSARAAEHTPDTDSRVALLFASSRGRLLTALVGLIAVLGIGRLGWRGVEPSVRATAAYRVQADAIQVTPAPAWIDPDFKRAALQSAGLDRAGESLSVLDEAGQVEQRLAAAFARSPYVLRVGRVRRLPPNRVAIELDYRVPAALAITSTGSEPLDESAVRLPRGRMTSADLAALPRLRLSPLEAAGLPGPPAVGAAWNDVRVVGASRLAARLGPLWKTLSLEDLAANPQPERRGSAAFPTFVLRTRSGTVIVWGAVEGMAPAGEPSFQAKINRLQQYVAKTGPLDSVAGTPRRIDVRYQLRIEPRVAKGETPAKTAQATTPEAIK
ncbi:hypothetical protein [Botrimarina hoheduenensis]|uniref:Cell division protein FtsQ n=1 Tax=Botrimarina hoheduenensis TaxID=2528000 RepID=A0A5C5VXW8_9BACT|nr:hypothetical protein [Botrimarina hoheduenensis]TWT42763.1 hypothetical protein Pla111_27360 [Botrimarina hoheduenensis]